MDGNDRAYEVILSDQPEPKLRSQVLGELLVFNQHRSGQSRDAKMLILLLRDGDGDLVGGLWGSTRWRWLTVDTLYVPEPMRRSGVGRRMMAEAEAEALRRDCVGACTESYSFQARGFYERLGYSVAGEIADYPPGHSRCWLVKRFEG